MLLRRFKLKKFLLNVVMGTTMLGNSLFAGGIADGNGHDEVPTVVALKMFRLEKGEEFSFDDNAPELGHLNGVDSSRKFIISSKRMTCEKEDLEPMIRQAEVSAGFVGFDDAQDSIRVTWEKTNSFHPDAAPGNWSIFIPLQMDSEVISAITFHDVKKSEPKKVEQPKINQPSEDNQKNSGVSSSNWLRGNTF